MRNFATAKFHSPIIGNVGDISYYKKENLLKRFSFFAFCDIYKLTINVWEENMQEYTDKEIFDQNYLKINADTEKKTREVIYDGWLSDFETEIENCKTPIVDLGCGLGNDTLYLIEKGKEVLACDYSDIAIETIQKDFPDVKTKIFDMTKQFPIEDNFTDIVIADLSIHYFTKEVTKRVIAEIKRILKPNGIFLFRVNSINDTNFISKQNQMEEDFYWEESQKRSKRCFSEESIREFFGSWKIEKIQEETMLRYGRTKMLWNCAVRKV